MRILCFISQTFFLPFNTKLIGWRGRLPPSPITVTGPPSFLLLYCWKADIHTCLTHLWVYRRAAEERTSMEPSRYQWIKKKKVLNQPRPRINQLCCCTIVAVNYNINPNDNNLTQKSPQKNTRTQLLLQRWNIMKGLIRSIPQRCSSSWCPVFAAVQWLSSLCWRISLFVWGLFVCGTNKCVWLAVPDGSLEERNDLQMKPSQTRSEQGGRE